MSINAQFTSSLANVPCNTISRPSAVTIAVENLGNRLLRWSERHSRVTQLSHEEMALKLANDRVLAVVREGRRW
jgi:hypothetical protein